MDLQENKSACGKAVVRMAARKMWPKSFKNYVPIAADCQDFATMKTELAEKGISCRGLADVAIAEACLEAEYCILQIKKGDAYHFILVKGLKRRRLSVYDPANGMIVSPATAWDGWYTGKALLLFKDTPPARVKQPRILHVDEILSLTALSLVRTLSAFLFLAATDSAASLGAGVLFLTIFCATILGTFLAANGFQTAFNRKIVRPQMLSGAGPEFYSAAQKAKSGALTFLIATLDKCGFLFVLLLIALLQKQRVLLWPLMLVLTVTVLITLAQKPWLERLKAQSGVAEDNFLTLVKTAENQALAEEKMAKRSAFLYALVKIGGAGLIVLTGALVAIMLLPPMATGGLKNFLSNLAFLESAAACLSALANGDQRLEHLRLGLYRLGPAAVNKLVKQGKKWYSFTAGKHGD